MIESKQDKEKGFVKIQAEFDVLNVHFTHVLDHLDKLVSNIQPRLIELKAEATPLPQPSPKEPSVMERLNDQLGFYKKNLATLDEIIQHLDTLV